MVRLWCIWYTIGTYHITSIKWYVVLWYTATKPQGTSMLKRKGLNYMHYSQTNSKKYRVEENQPTAISVILGKDREMTAEKKREALENPKRSLEKRTATEGQMVIEREKKGKQRAKTLRRHILARIKETKMSEETNFHKRVQVKDKRQKEKVVANS